MHKPVAEKVKETEIEVGLAFESGDRAGSDTETESEVVIEFGFGTLVKFDLRLEAESTGLLSVSCSILFLAFSINCDGQFFRVDSGIRSCVSPFRKNVKKVVRSSPRPRCLGSRTHFLLFALNLK